MGIKLLPLLVLALAALCFPFETEGGNVTTVQITGGENFSSVWSGIAGHRSFSGAFSMAFNASPGGISEINVTFPAPGCAYSSIILHVIASASQNASLPLAPGNLSLSSGNYTNVPYALTCGANCTVRVLPTYYLQDANGSFVFVGTVIPGSPGALGTADYQMILPTNGANATYYMKGDINFTCVSGNVTPAPSQSSHVAAPIHMLDILPIGGIAATIGNGTTVAIIIKNIGNVTERNIDVYAEGGLFSAHFTIPTLYVGDSLTGNIGIIPYEIGNLSVTAVAKSNDAVANRIFNIVVLPQCVSDSNCSASQYCSGYRCIARLPDKSPCSSFNQCMSNRCAKGFCGGCKQDSECMQSQLCIAGSCVDILGGECGYFSNHMFVQYRCCADSDCGTLMQCTDHACVKSDFTVIQESTPTENESALITIVDRNGNPMPGIPILGDGTTDGNGRAEVTAPHDGNICLRFGNETRCKKIDVYLIGDIYVEGLPVEGRQFSILIRDLAGEPVPFVDISADGIPVGKTDVNGRIAFSLPSSGNADITGEKLGYKIGKKTVTIIGKERICDLPFKESPLMPVLDTYHPPIILVSLALMAISFILMRRINIGLIPSLAYAALPAVSIPLGEAACGMLSSSMVFAAFAGAAYWFMVIRNVASSSRGGALKR
jgi:hypothetical protein